MLQGIAAAGSCHQPSHAARDGCEAIEWRVRIADDTWHRRLSGRNRAPIDPDPELIVRWDEAGSGTITLGDTSALQESAVQELFAQAQQKRLKPVALTAEEVSLFYDGYSNAVLWPLFHYLLDKVQLEASEEWRAYVSVNERFAEAIAAEVEGSETVWIHDYQLCLVPSMLRQRASLAASSPSGGARSP